MVMTTSFFERIELLRSTRMEGLLEVTIDRDFGHKLAVSNQDRKALRAVFVLQAKDVVREFSTVTEFVEATLAGLRVKGGAILLDVVTNVSAHADTLVVRRAPGAPLNVGQVNRHSPCAHQGEESTRRCTRMVRPFGILRDLRVDQGAHTPVIHKAASTKDDTLFGAVVLTNTRLVGEVVIARVDVKRVVFANGHTDRTTRCVVL